MSTLEAWVAEVVVRCILDATTRFEGLVTIGSICKKITAIGIGVDN